VNPTLLDDGLDCITYKATGLPPSTPLPCREKDALRSAMCLQHANLGYPLRNIISIAETIEEVKREIGYVALAQQQSTKKYALVLHETTEIKQYYLNDGVASEWCPVCQTEWQLSEHEGRTFMSNGMESIFCDDYFAEKAWLLKTTLPEIKCTSSV
jgi:hypothetical protein